MAQEPDGGFAVPDSFSSDLRKVERFHQIMRAKMLSIVQRIRQAGLGIHTAKRAKIRAWEAVRPAVLAQVGLSPN